MKFILSSLSFFISLSGFSQVGVGTINPQATLEVSASNPETPQASEGILIPRINHFPTTNPGAEQDGMLIFLNQEITSETENLSYPRGFYFWNNNTQSWENIRAGKDHDFYVFETTENPNSIEDDVYRTGSLSIGETEDKAKLNVIVTNENVNLPKTALYIENNHPSTGSSYTSFGIDVENSSAINGKTYGIRVKNSSAPTDNKYGIFSQVTSSGTGAHYGFYNETSQGSTSTNNMFGIWNQVNKTHGAASFNYGIYNSIGSATSAGNIIGIYSKAEGNSSANTYAAFFSGKVSIGPVYNQSDYDNLITTNHYTLPETRGNEGDVLTATNNGETVWQTNNTYAIETISTPITNFNVTASMSTIRILAAVNNISLPNASEVLGKVFTIINASGIPANFIFPDSAAIQDDVTNSEINFLATNKRITIQSDGTNWIVIGN